MLSRRRLIVKGLAPEHFKGDLNQQVNEHTFNPRREDYICDECGEEMTIAYYILRGRKFCRSCSPWHKEQEERDKKNLILDLKRKWEER